LETPTAALNASGPLLPRAARLGCAALRVALEELDHGAGHVAAAGLLHALDAGRRIDLHHDGTAVGAQQIDARYVEPQHLRRADSRAALVLRHHHRLGLAAAMQIGAELAHLARAHHAGDDLAADDEHADVVAARLLDVFLHEDVHVGGAERLDDGLGRSR